MHQPLLHCPVVTVAVTKSVVHAMLGHGAVHSARIPAVSATIMAYCGRRFAPLATGTLSVCTNWASFLCVLMI